MAYSFEETASLVQEVLGELRQPAEKQLFKACVETRQDIADSYTNTTESIELALSDYRKRVERLQVLVAKTTASCHSVGGQKLTQKQAKSSIIKTITDMEHEIHTIDEARASLRKERTELLERMNTAMGRKDGVPRAKESVSLFASISHMKLDEPTTSGEVKGYVTVPQQNDVRPFAFDSRALSRGALADALWGLVPG